MFNNKEEKDPPTFSYRKCDTESRTLSVNGVLFIQPDFLMFKLIFITMAIWIDNDKMSFPSFVLSPNIALRQLATKLPTPPDLCRALLDFIYCF